MKSLNKVILIGHLGGDPELKYLPNGTTVANVKLATNEGYKDQKSGEWQEKTEWHSIVGYGRVAEILGEYFQKGNLVCIEGKIRTRTWEKDGSKKYFTEILANNVMNLSGKPKGDGPGSEVDEEVPF